MFHGADSPDDSSEDDASCDLGGLFLTYWCAEGKEKTMFAKTVRGNEVDVIGDKGTLIDTLVFDVSSGLLKSCKHACHFRPKSHSFDPIEPYHEFKMFTKRKYVVKPRHLERLRKARDSNAAHARSLVLGSWVNKTVYCGIRALCVQRAAELFVCTIAKRDGSQKDGIVFPQGEFDNVFKVVGPDSQEEAILCYSRETHSIRFSSTTYDDAELEKEAIVTTGKRLLALEGGFSTGSKKKRSSH